MEFMAMPCIQSFTAIRRLSGVQPSSEGQTPIRLNTPDCFFTSKTLIDRAPNDEVANFVASGDHAIEALIWFGSSFKCFGNHRDTSATRFVRLLLMSVTYTISISAVRNKDD